MRFFLDFNVFSFFRKTLLFLSLSLSLSLSLRARDLFFAARIGDDVNFVLNLCEGAS